MYKKYIFIFLIPFLLFSCKTNIENDKKEIITDNVEIENIEEKENVFSGDFEELIEIFPEIEEEKLQKIHNASRESNFKELQNLLPEVIETLKSQDEPDVNLVKYVQFEFIQSALNEGTIYFKEKQKAQEMIEYIEEVKQEVTYFDPVYINYNLGYAYEIIKDFSQALRHYELAFNNAPDIEKNKKIRGIILNQIGHVYDLMGENKKANEYYLQVEENGVIYVGNFINRGRYEYRMGNYEQAQEYFKKVLALSKDLTVQAEMYFNLSTIEMLKGEKDSLQKSRIIAQKGIEIFPDYPYNHMNVGITYYLESGSENFEIAKKYLQDTISINPYIANTYKYLGIMAYIEDQYEDAVKNFKLQAEVAPRDMVLMKNDQEKLYFTALYDISRSYALMGNEEESLKYLDMLLGSGKQYIYYTTLMGDIARDNSPFAGIMGGEKFQKQLSKIILLYKN